MLRPHPRAGSRIQRGRVQRSGRTCSAVAEPLRLMCVLAHPDEESLAAGGTLAKYAREGVDTFVVLATCGERGRCGAARERPSAEILGRIREQEAREAASVLGVRELRFVVNSVERCPVPWPDWAVTTVIDTTDCCQAVWRAVRCHRTQTAHFPGLDQPGGHRQRILWGLQRYCRVISLVNGGCRIETDLFEGVR